MHSPEMDIRGWIWKANHIKAKIIPFIKDIEHEATIVHLNRKIQKVGMSRT
jgi:hypothetical protein